MCASDRPSPPQNLRVKEVYKDYVVLAWDAPEFDGGSPVTSFRVDKKDAAKTSFIKADQVSGNVYELKVVKLVEGKEYDFRVFAENDIGQSDAAVLQESVKARLPFGECFTMK